MHGSSSDLWIKSTFQIGNLNIAWYAICILIGIVIAVLVGIREGKRLGVPSDHILTGVIIVLPCAIVGARLWYVVNTIGQINWTFTKIIGMDDNGLAGLAIQGGVIFALIAVYIYLHLPSPSAALCYTQVGANRRRLHGRGPLRRAAPRLLDYQPRIAGAGTQVAQRRRCHLGGLQYDV